jgi:hypothetical protein
VDCNETFRWIWEVLEAPAVASGELERHLDGCDLCRAEIEARRSLDLDFRELRAEEQEEPSEAVNRRVLSALGAPAGGTGTKKRPALGLVPQQIAAETPPLPASVSRTVLREVSPLLALSAALAASLLLGFILGQSRVSWPQPASAVQVIQPQPRSHQVVLSERGLEALGDGNTYMLIGPSVGPYQVIDVTSWDRADAVGPTSLGRDELVIAVGPAGGWSRGKTVLLGDLAGSGAEILARRALTP